MFINEEIDKSFLENFSGRAPWQNKVKILERCKNIYPDFDQLEPFAQVLLLLNIIEEEEKQPKQKPFEDLRELKRERVM